MIMPPFHHRHRSAVQHPRVEHTALERPGKNIGATTALRMDFRTVRGDAWIMKTLNHSAVYVETTRANIHDIVRTLIDAIGAEAVGHIAGTTDTTAPHRWAHPEGSALDILTEERLRLGYRVWLTLQSLEDPHAAVAWLMSPNRALDEERPMDFIARLHAQQVVNTAESLVTGTEKR